MNYEAWIGRTQTEDDVASAAAVARLAALLDHGAPPWPPRETPPLGHWLYFLPEARQSELDEDGHPKRGDFLPPVPFPRRMWAGGRVSFLDALPIGGAIRRRSTIMSVTPKQGASGPMVFITVQHEIFAGEKRAIIEEQDIVYRGAAPPAEPPTPPQESARLPDLDATRRVAADAVALFRYSALTFNAHRIHYDREYARNVEHYPGLVVQGPFIATLLMDLFMRHHPGARVAGFHFRGARPLFDGAPFDLCLRNTPDGASLWACDAQGRIAMSAEATAA